MVWNRLEMAGLRCDSSDEITDTFSLWESDSDWESEGLRPEFKWLIMLEFNSLFCSAPDFWGSFLSDLADVVIGLEQIHETVG